VIGELPEAAMPKVIITIAVRVAMYADAIRIIDQKSAQLRVDRARALDDLAKAEAEVLGKAAGSEGVKLSGIIPPGHNPYYEPPIPVEPEPVKATAPAAPEEGEARPAKKEKKL
jgi:hypothetical protein